MSISTPSSPWKPTKMFDTLTVPPKISIPSSRLETISFSPPSVSLKGDGKFIVVLINKKNNHRPESIDAIDYSKTIIWNIAEHQGLETSQSFGNSSITFTPTFAFITPDFVIGSALDNNLPVANPVTDLKAWESGNYYLGVLYQNTTYNMSLFHYIDVTLEM